MFLGERIVFVRAQEVPLEQVCAFRPPHDDSAVQEVPRASWRPGGFVDE